MISIESSIKDYFLLTKSSRLSRTAFGLRVASVDSLSSLIGVGHSCFSLYLNIPAMFLPPLLPLSSYSCHVSVGPSAPHCLVYKKTDPHVHVNKVMFSFFDEIV